jgi:hypothetical protein
VKAAEKILIAITILLFLGGTVVFCQEADFSWEVAGKGTDWNRAFAAELSGLLEDEKIPRNVIDLMMEELLDYPLDGTPEELAAFVSASLLQVDRQLRRGSPPAAARYELKNLIETRRQSDRGTGIGGVKGSSGTGIRSKMNKMSKKITPKNPERAKMIEEQKPGGSGNNTPGQGEEQGPGQGQGPGQDDTSGKEGSGN